MSTEATAVRSGSQGHVRSSLWNAGECLIRGPWMALKCIWFSLTTPITETVEIITNWSDLSRKARLRGYSMLISMITFIIWIFLFIWALRFEGKKRMNLFAIALGATLLGFALLLYCLINALKCPNTPIRQVSLSGVPGLSKYVTWFLEEFVPETAFVVLVLGMLMVLVVMVDKSVNVEETSVEKRSITMRLH
ncbi:hypothetical protein TWF506_009685 [Arthrobotrys conoides]|uniref:Uncharacterized protein n=1 Tax=Arthrobotrys conoides TaxID=74498 RepID=A0AAN8RQF7_9PEZI